MHAQSTVNQMSAGNEQSRREMSWETWWGIAQRQVRYKQRLDERMAEWSTERINTSWDLRELQGVIKLARRVIRHKQRLERHHDRGAVFLDRLPTAGGMH